MPSLSDKTASTIIRALLIGDSGSGKTGSLTSLVEAGYNLHIADFDNGLDVLASLLKKIDPELLKYVDYGTFRDSYKVLGDKPVPVTADAWMQGIKYIEKVCTNKSYGENDVLVIDSLSFAAKSAMNHILKLNGRLSMAPWQSDYGEAQRLVESLVGMLTDDEIKVNVICTAHISFIGNEENGEPVKGFPSLIGKALGPVIPRYFNHALLCRAVGSGAGLSQRIHTVTFGNIELKNTNPGVVKPDYDLKKGGLATYFRDAKGGKEPTAAAA